MQILGSAVSIPVLVAQGHVRIYDIVGLRQSGNRCPPRRFAFVEDPVAPLHLPKVCEPDHLLALREGNMLGCELMRGNRTHEGHRVGDSKSARESKRES